MLLNQICKRIIISLLCPTYSIILFFLIFMQQNGRLDYFNPFCINLFYSYHLYPYLSQKVAKKWIKVTIILIIYYITQSVISGVVFILGIYFNAFPLRYGS